MNSVKEWIFRTDDSYREQLKKYSYTDTLIAIGYYVLILIVYYVMGLLVANTGRYLGVPVSIILMLIPLIICRRLLPVGLANRNLKRSLIVSGLIGLVFLLSYTIIPGILGGLSFLPWNKILGNLIYYFVIIGLSEEISFRGFIQPRLFPVVKREWLMILVGGVLFVMMHYPFQMAARNMTFTQYWPQFIASAPFQLLWHLAFSQQYRRYGNIYGSSVLHGCVDMSMGIFG